MHVRRWMPIAFASVGALLASSDAAAQRRSAAVPASCPAIPRPGTVSSANVAEAARLRERGQEAAILGDPREARRFFARAVQLNPRDARSAYQLARAAEQTGDSEVAVREYCRFLTLTPRAAESQAVRNRLAVLTRGRTRVAQADPPPRREPTRRADPPAQPPPRPETQQPPPAATQTPARPEPEPPRPVTRTDTVVRGGTVATPPPIRARDTVVAERAPEERPEREPATPPTVTEPAAAIPETTESPDVFTGPRPENALLRGLVLPGLGQHHTGRTGLGVAILSAAGAAAILAYTPRDDISTETYTDPFGNEYQVTYEDREYPYWSAGIAAAIGITVLGAAEAYFYAQRKRRAVASESPLNAAMARRIAPTVAPSPRGVDVGLSVRF